MTTMSAKPTPLGIYGLLPRKNCGVCGVPTCMAFAFKLFEGSLNPEACPFLTDEAKTQLERTVSPPVKRVSIGVEKQVVIGGKRVLHRHELRFTNPTAIGIEVADSACDEAIRKRLMDINGFRVERVGQALGVDLVAVVGTSKEPRRFREAVSVVHAETQLPLALCADDPRVVEAGLTVVDKKRPLIYAAQPDTLTGFMELSKRYRCPLVLKSHDLNTLRYMASIAVKEGVSVVLDPCTYLKAALRGTLHNFVTVRRAAVEHGYSEFGSPLLAYPALAWSSEVDPTDARWRESLLASMLILRYADILILRSLETCWLLPVYAARHGIYTDPRVPASVKPGLYSVGVPDETSPVLATTNYTLTYYTVMRDLEKAGVNCHILVLDTGGMSVLNALAGGQLNAQLMAQALKQLERSCRVRHRTVIIPGSAARLRGEVEDLTGWEVILGPMDSAGIPVFLKTSRLRWE